MNIETQISTELWSVVRTRWENRDFSGAVLDGMYYLSDLIRQKGDLEGDGVALVGQAFGGSNPRIKVTRLHTESDRNIQAGTEAILRGMYQAIRNPRSHEKVKDAEADALAILVFLDYMIRVIGEARAMFSEQEFLQQVFDEDFVEEERYATLLVEEVPAKKRLEIALEVFRQRGHGNGTNLRLLFDKLLPRLSEDEEQDFFREVSESLKVEDDQEQIRLAVTALPPEKWGLVAEVARLRVENKFLKAIERGRYNYRTERCTDGAFGTWGRRILSQSLLLDKVKHVLIKKLRSDDREERGYVVKFFFSWLCELPDMPSRSLELAVKSRLREGDKDVKAAADLQYLFDHERGWSESTGKALESFVPVEPELDPSEPDDGLPF